MDLYHKTSPHKLEALRLFNVIQEFSTNPRPVLSAEAIGKFLQKIGIQANQDAIKFLHYIDKEGCEMNQEYWGVCISKAFSKLSLNSPNDLD